MESEKNQVEVVICGKVYKLSGVESVEYIQKIARYIDNKLEEINRTTSHSVTNSNLFPILIAINIADDLFKEKKKNEDTPIIDSDVLAVYEKEIHKLTEENLALKDRIDHLVIELSSAKRELAEFIETFDETKFEIKNDKKDG